MNPADRPSTDEQLIARAITADETIPLRMTCLRPGYPRAASIFPGDEDPLTGHAGAWLGDQLVSIGSIYLEARPDAAPGEISPPPPDHDAGTAWRLRGMATADEARRRGAGTAVLELCIEHARAQGGTLAWCNARLTAIVFYESQGWRVISDTFDVPTVGPHVVMERSLR